MGYLAVPTLMFVTLGIVFVLGGGLAIWHFRKPQNRHPMEGQPERTIEEIRGEPPIRS